MKVLLFQLDGKLPNIAVMRIAAHHRARGDDIEFRWVGHNCGSPQRELWDSPERVYGSAIFERSQAAVMRLREEFQGAIVGGTGVSVGSSLEAIGITTIEQDYSIYPEWRQSIGFTQRGCRLRCSFCVVPRKEGAMRGEQTIAELWRGEPWPRELLLLDNDFFGQEQWRERVREIRDGGFKVSFVQGINARFLTDEAAEAIASMDYRDDSMRVKRIYTAWDNRRDEQRLFAGLKRLVKYGVQPDQIMVYMLVGYDHVTQAPRAHLVEEDFHRRTELRAFGARPYPMPFVRSKELVGFQRWIVGAYDKRIPWEEWKDADFRPEKLHLAIEVGGG